MWHLQLLHKLSSVLHVWHLLERVGLEALKAEDIQNVKVHDVVHLLLAHRLVDTRRRSGRRGGHGGDGGGSGGSSVMERLVDTCDEPGEGEAVQRLWETGEEWEGCVLCGEMPSHYWCVASRASSQLLPHKLSCHVPLRGLPSVAHVEPLPPPRQRDVIACGHRPPRGYGVSKD